MLEPVHGQAIGGPPVWGAGKRVERHHDLSATRASMHGLAAGAARLQWMTCRSRCGMEVLDWGRRMGVRVAEEDRGLGFQG